MTVKQRLLKIVLNAKGDDLERCNEAYRGSSQEAMSKEYGQSGFTRQQIVDRYKKERAEWEEVYKYVQEVTSGE